MAEIPNSSRIEVSIDVHDTFHVALLTKERPVKLMLPAGSTVGDALAQIGLTEKQPWNAALRGKLVSPQDILSDGDRLLVFEPIAGG